MLSSEQISKILPHRYPFLLVDRVVEMEPGKRAVGIKCVTANEPQFTVSPFPDRPIMPGVLMIEAMAQLEDLSACSLLSVRTTAARRSSSSRGVSGVRWKSPVTPGDMLCMEMNLIDFDERLGLSSPQRRVRGARSP